MNVKALPIGREVCRDRGFELLTFSEVAPKFGRAAWACAIRRRAPMDRREPETPNVRPDGGAGPAAPDSSHNGSSGTCCCAAVDPTASGR